VPSESGACPLFPKQSPNLVSKRLGQGANSDLKRVLRLIERPFESLMDAHVAERTASVRRQIAETERRVQRTTEMMSTYESVSARESLQERLLTYEAELEALSDQLIAQTAEARDAGRIELTLTSSREETRTVTGSADDLSEWLEGRKFSAIELSAPSGRILHYRIKVTGGGSGLSMDVSSRNAQWATAAFADLVGEAEHRMPPWRILRTVSLLFPLYTFVIGVTLSNIGDAIALLTTESGTFNETVGSVAWMVLFAATGSGAVLLTDFTRRTLPAFELVPSGSRSRGGAFLGVIGSAVGALGLGIVGNMLTSWLISGQT
jgi:hypothetical protein